MIDCIHICLFVGVDATNDTNAHTIELICECESIDIRVRRSMMMTTMFNIIN